MTQSAEIKLVTDANPHDNLFIGIFPKGISYCDKNQEQDGDYKKIAFLPYDTLMLRIYDYKSELIDSIDRDATTIQAKIGQSFSVSTSGQTVTLGGALIAVAPEMFELLKVAQVKIFMLEGSGNPLYQKIGDIIDKIEPR